ncbi:MAG: hypothetical protein J0I20_35035 [Chloroflexi bacterium]|nr:hypothetical protein [Chloroflexota bacterium]
MEASEIEEPVSREDGGLALPPFKVLLQWLHFYHARTGSWPEPEELATFLVPATANRSANIPNYSVATNTHPDNKAITTELSSQTMEKRLLKFVPVKSTREKEAVNLKAALDRATSFELKSSPYYRAALDLIEKHAAFNTLSDTAVLTLGSLLAWCNYPKFIANFEEKGFGPSMYLPLEQWSKTLKMRKATLSACIKELEKTGLLLTHAQTSAGTAKRCYRLAVPLGQTLPTFDPCEAIGEREPAAEPESINTQPLGTQMNSEPEVMTHEQNYNLIQNKNNKPMSNQDLNKKNHGHEGPVEPGTVEEKLTFLVEVASFPGYTSPEGLVTLDKREALKFATASQLDLNSLKRIYHHTLKAWTNGKCTKNPIGFFHRSLSAHLNQQGTANLTTPFQPALPDLENLPSFKVPGTGISKFSGSRFPKQAVRRNGSPIYSDDKSVATAQSDLAGTEDYPGQQATSNQVSFVDFFNRDQTVFTLQTQVLAALENRFKQPELAKILAQLKWRMSLAEGKVRVGLENTGAMNGPAPVFGQSELSLLKIALSQSIRSLTGVGTIEESFEIEIVIID